jgi:pimeloyl-ACP methyl ester carboxylesterase
MTGEITPFEARIGPWTESEVARAGGVRLRVAQAGAGGRPLLLVHGFTGTKEDFGTMVPRLAEAGFHAATFDHRGHGASDQPGDPAAYSLELLVADTLAVADALGWDRFDLLGHSMGGMVAQLVVLQQPQRVRRLVLMDTGHGPAGRLTEEWIAGAEAIVQEGGMAALAAAFAGPDPDDPGGDTPADRRLRTEDPAYRAWCDRKLLGTSPVAMIALARAMRVQDDRLAALASLPVPTLVLVGAQDEPFLDAADRMAAAIPGARLAVLPDAGHCPQFESPGAWWDAVAGFLTAP